MLRFRERLIVSGWSYRVITVVPKATNAVKESEYGLRNLLTLSTMQIEMILASKINHFM